LFSSSTLNMAFGNGSTTVAITSIASSLLIDLQNQFSVVSCQFSVNHSALIEN
jgi:hypothetical protein